MPESFVHGELVLHSPSVLLPRTARLYAKLTRVFGECLNPLFMEYGFCTRLQLCMRVCNLVESALFLQARKSILRLFVR